MARLIHTLCRAVKSPIKVVPAVAIPGNTALVDGAKWWVVLLLLLTVVAVLIARTTTYRRSTGAYRDAAEPPGGGRRLPVQRGPGRAAHHEVEVVSRTPHIDMPFDGRVAPGTTFTVVVRADDQAPHVGEVAVERIAVPFPRDVEDVEVDVTLLATDHFEVADPSGFITVRRTVANSTTAPFKVSVLDEARLRTLDKPPHWLAQGALTAVFHHRGRPCGRVRRAVELEVEVDVGDGIDQGAGEPRRAAASPALVAIERGAVQADLVVHVVDDEDEPDSYRCMVTTSLVEVDAEDAGYQRWRLGDRAERVVGNYMAGFTEPGKSAGQRISGLLGAGERLFEAAPRNFRRTFWKIVDSGRTLKTIAIVSEEPYIPWELMVPVELPARPARRPLGVEYTVARWTSPDSISPPQIVPLTDSYAIAPTYVKRPLKHAQAEAEWITTQFEGSILPSTFDDIEDELTARTRGLLHFACHGTNDGASGQAVLLDDRVRLLPTEVRGARFRDAFRTARPFVFLNACEVGRLTPTLVGPGGFSAEFIDMQASGVVAPLWSVKDTVAHKVALAFYERVLEDPSVPFAAVMKELRALAYVRPAEAPEADAPLAGEDSCAAYVFYGDPLAARRAP